MKIQLINPQTKTRFNIALAVGQAKHFAALEITTGLVKVNHYNRRRRIEFLDFMNGVIEQYPNLEIHVIPDNLTTHDEALLN